MLRNYSIVLIPVFYVNRFDEFHDTFYAKLLQLAKYFVLINCFILSFENLYNSFVSSYPIFTTESKSWGSLSEKYIENVITRIEVLGMLDHCIERNYVLKKIIIVGRKSC